MLVSTWERAQCHVELISFLNIVVCRIAQLEKDLYYYKTTSREFKKKLRSVSRESVQGELDTRQSSTEPNRDVGAAAGESAVTLQRMSKHCLLCMTVVNAYVRKFFNCPSA